MGQKMKGMKSESEFVRKNSLQRNEDEVLRGVRTNTGEKRAGQKTIEE